MNFIRRLVLLISRHTWDEEDGEEDEDSTFEENSISLKFV